GAICGIFAPLGFGDWQSTVATITGLVAKENVVSTCGVLFGVGAEATEETTGLLIAFGAHYTMLSAYCFMVFNLLCAPCFAAIGAMSREMNNAKWTWAAIGYMCGFSYCVTLMIYQFGSLFTGGGFTFGTLAAIIVLAGFIYMLARKGYSGNDVRNETSVEAAAAVE
ncbi:MAG: nucleoside recognition domain-containing protein, partial [Coriobacteriales bacterium]